LRSTLFIAISFTFFIFDSQFTFLSPVKDLLSLCLTPIQYTASFPSELFDIVATDFSTKKELIIENNRLKEKEFLLQAQVQKLVFLEEENEKLKTLLGATTKINEKVLAAQLLAVDFSNLNKQVVLNRGKNDNAYIGQPVLDAYGFMGQVISADSISSRVLLITDSQSAIPVMNVRSGLRSVAIGIGLPNTLELAYVSDTADVKAGDLFVTSNLGLRLPEGYPVGVVNTVGHVAGERFAKVILTPSAKVDSSRYVLMIWPGQPKIEKTGAKDIKATSKTMQKTKSKYK
jgi:rod shape-determining protein MreC